MKLAGENWDYDPARKQRIAYLVAGFLEQTLNPQEQTELDQWINASESNQRIFEDLIDTQKLKQGFMEVDELDINAAKERIGLRIQEGGRIPVRKWWPKYAAAAAILLTFGLGYLYFTGRNETETITATPGDILPGGNKATLTLANGSTISLTELSSGNIAPNIKKIKDGELNYDSTFTLADQFNTLTTPKGGQYSVKLPDGTLVTLNAASSLRYPLAFTGHTRTVELTGEAFFEVVKNAGKPFIVSSFNQQVQVLGTHFNINAYTEEKLTATTLVEGKVKVTAAGKDLTLSPGQQAVLDSQMTLKSVTANLAETLAWKEGNFEFVNTPLPAIMRQVARWYDAEIIYEQPINLHFNASISRNTPVSQLLHYLETTDRVHFTITGNKIIVKP